VKAIFKLFLVFSAFAWISCEESNDPVIDESELLLGYWINPVWVDTIVRYERGAELKENDYGICFKTGHSFVERKNEGWCGTPPVIMDDFPGTWTRQGSIIDIDVSYWGGMAHYQWKVISLDKTSLSIATVKQEFHE
jgi:hypothetical protein